MPRPSKSVLSLVSAAIVAAMIPATARADISGFGDFSQFTINKNDSGPAPTFPAPGTIELINGTNEARSIFADTPQDVSQFTASFTYRLVNPGTGEGAAFVLQNDAAGASTVGTGNHGLRGVQPSFEISFGIGQNQTALVTDGDGNGHGGVNIGPVSFASGDPIDVQLIYSASTLTETLTDEVTSASFNTTYRIFIPDAVFGNTAFVGLTAGSSTDSVDQLFSNFEFTSNSSVPEPATLGLAAAGAAWGLIRRRPRAT